MARTTIDDDISQTKEDSGRALNGALLSFIGTAIALVLSLFALNIANDSRQEVTELNRKFDQLQTQMNDITGQGDFPTSGAGVGPNNVQPPEATGNLNPNANGQ